MSLLNEETEILNRTTYFPHEHIGNYTSIVEKQVKNFILKETKTEILPMRQGFARIQGVFRL
jgi:hypothetical protein